MTTPTYAAVDWGTTSFRAWAIGGNGAVLGETRAKDGLTTAAERGFETVLEGHLAALGLGPDAPAILCGMVGSRAGWIEAAYLDTPLELGDLGARATKVPGIARAVYILPGLAQRAAWEPDVMRGEETQLLGVVAEGYRSGLVCMPGTHSKWVSLTDGVIDAFSTFMTGELFQLLRSHSILCQAVEGEASVSASPDFLDGVRRAFETPALATNFLFSIRAGWLLHGAEPQAQAARLSGLLLGLELAGAAERHGSLKGAALLASGPIAELYAAAFEAIGMGAFRRLDADACVRHGLAQAARSLFSAES